MSQKKNKERKQQLLNYKTKIKNQMSKEQEQLDIQKIPQLKQFPIWKSQEEIIVSGLEWEAIYNALNIFRQGIVAAESVMQRNTESGKITMKFVDENDQEVAPEKVAEYTKQLQEYFAKRAESEKSESPKSSILTAEGEPATSNDIAPSESPNPLRAV